MNMNILEKLSRQAVKGNNIAGTTNVMFSNGFITPVEHRSLKSLSWQIAANVRANADGTATMLDPMKAVQQVWW